jgi:hypothetical protein
MRELKSLAPLADLDTQRSCQPLRESGEGYFIPTEARYYAVTLALWLGLTCVAASIWFSAWSVGVAFTRWMGA